MKQIFLFVPVILWGVLSVAFDRERCSGLFPKSDDTHPPYYSPLYVSTMVPSTTSYVSSVGPCSMYGQGRASARQIYFEKTYASIQSDAARGQGEYLAALADLSGCPQNDFNSFAQSHFSDLFLDSNLTDSRAVLEKLDSGIRSDESLRQKCVWIN